jgi:anhydro-N-acetylmuramic acid kinase
LGEPAYLAEELGVPVVNDFRAADIAAGGQGAPLATLFHQWAFAESGAHVCVHNLGGISNVTSIDWRKGRGTAPEMLSFDTGPANVLMDLAARHYSGDRRSCDLGGRRAARGTISEGLLTEWLRHPYFRQRPPKSTGRELFGEPFFVRVVRESVKLNLSELDLMATLAEFTARSIRLNYQRHLPSVPNRVILSGGGVGNPFLVKAIRRELEQLGPGIHVDECKSVGWPANSIEPAAFALLAWLRVKGKPGNLPSTTGARHAVLCGQVTQPIAGRSRLPRAGQSRRAGR